MNNHLTEEQHPVAMEEDMALVMEVATDQVQLLVMAVLLILLQRIVAQVFQHRLQVIMLR